MSYTQTTTLLTLLFITSFSLWHFLSPSRKTCWWQQLALVTASATVRSACVFTAMTVVDLPDVVGLGAQTVFFLSWPHSQIEGTRRRLEMRTVCTWLGGDVTFRNGNGNALSDPPFFNEVHCVAYSCTHKEYLGIAGWGCCCWCCDAWLWILIGVFCYFVLCRLTWTGA